MKKVNFVLIVFSVIFFKTEFVFAQISTNEKPVSFSQSLPSSVLKSDRGVVIMPVVDVVKLLQEDAVNEGAGKPFRFGYEHRVNFDLTNSGMWIDLPNGDRLWQLKIVCPSALSVNLLYDKFWLPDGAKFFVYSADKKHTIGAFTSINNKGSENNLRGFATELIHSSEVILECYLPKVQEKQPVISVCGVVHGYRSMSGDEAMTKSSLKSSLGCNIPVNLQEGKEWQQEKNAIGMIVTGNITASGALLRTTADKYEPVFLTAHHYIRDIQKDAISDPYLDCTLFYWHYESSIKNFVTSGGTVLANNSSTDFALLKLDEDPLFKTGVTPYYLGWNRIYEEWIEDPLNTKVASIHHPLGDPKKITLGAGVFGSNAYWIVDIYKGGLQHGSSGAPLIDSKTRTVIGQLKGGRSGIYCAPMNNIYYGRFDLSWDGKDGSVNATENFDKRRRLRDWLDPLKKNVSKLAGVAAPITGRYSIFGEASVCIGNINTFKINNIPQNASIVWNSEANSISLLSGQGTSSATFRANDITGGHIGAMVVYNGQGTYVRSEFLNNELPEKPILDSPYKEGAKFEERELLMPFRVNNNIDKATEYLWKVSGDANVTSKGRFGYVETTMYNKGYFNVTVQASNRCGVGPVSDSWSGYVNGRSSWNDGGKYPPIVSTRMMSSVDESSMSIRVYSVPNGILVYSKDKVVGFDIQNTSLKKGIYIVEKKTEDGSVTTDKIVKE